VVQSLKFKSVMKY